MDEPQEPDRVAEQVAAFIARRERIAELRRKLAEARAAGLAARQERRLRRKKEAGA